MNRNYFSKIILLIGLSCSATVLAASEINSDVASLINQRLSYMKDVAGYKAANHLAIEDLPQEEKVLASATQQAEKLGLEGESVKPFVQAQMDAAKAIQYRYRADWLSTPEQNWQPLPLDQVRTKINALSASILSGIRTDLTRGEHFSSEATFLQALNQTHLAESDKARLWETLQKVRLKQSQ
ncbi:chorismate mutase [Pantoea sp. Acro-805]|uniref:Chorismate mutase n=1 Tax=Candidatus Pantoea formicae TaxID=2608355 RepID=A0ABX0QPD7_9GAMM|nr:chorismate mutase [Pantoea formicae]MDF7647600.1 chorismate mutase [Erwiniaceae bacterium L1_54_3]NIE98937.1 chorismate mutase [Pantoea formicae]